MTIRHYTVNDAILDITNRLTAKNIPYGPELSTIISKVISEHARQYDTVAETYCDLLVDKIDALFANDEPSFQELAYLAKLPAYFMVDHMTAVTILKNAGLSHPVTMNLLLNADSSPRHYSYDIATAMVLLNKVGLLDANFKTLKEHDNPATLATPLRTLLENNILKAEYAEVVFTNPSEIGLIVELEKAKIKFNLVDDVLTNNPLPLVLRFIAYMPVSGGEDTLLTQKNVDALRTLRNDRVALHDLLDRVNQLSFMKSDYNQASFDSAVYYAAKKLPLPLEYGHRLGSYLLSPLSSLSIFHSSLPAPDEKQDKTASIVNRPG